VDFLTFESTRVKNVHVLGDAIQIATGMPKSGHMANQHAKVCAAAVVLVAVEPVAGAPFAIESASGIRSDRRTIRVFISLAV
jgi:NADH dehydrogenase FAD-containing subunit